MKKARYLTPVVTAMDAHGGLDKPANLRVWKHLIDGGVDGIVLLGSIGEFFALTMPQKKELIETAVSFVRSKTRIYVGTGSMSVEETVSLSNYALAAGADAVMVISPYYFALDDAGMEAFYDAVASRVHGPLYLYNFPDRTGYDLNPEVTLRLLRKHRNIIGYKDTVAQIGHTRALLTAILPEFPGFDILSGFDEHFAFNVLSGGGGCIGGLSNIEPALFAAWVKAANDGNWQESSRIQQTVNKLMALYGVVTPFVPAIKRAMRLWGLPIEDHCAAPLQPVAEAQSEAILNILSGALKK